MAMVARAEAQKLLSNLQALGGRKLGALALIGVVAIALVSLAAFYLSKPTMESLYSGLDRQDVTRIGAALTEAGIPFDVNAAGDTVMTNFSQTANARMLLAEKGLPRSENAGYELFDSMGSMGLTTFMQEVTRVRALEGELARTIQTLKDVRAARVHIVLPEPGSFRRESQKPSASVVIRTDNTEDFANAQAIRHLVSSAIPGMQVDQVTVLNTDGTLLASGDDASNATSTKQLGMEGIVSSSIQDSIRRTLAPYLGVGNFQSSVIARLDTDRRQISSRKFDPDGRVERSTRTVRETGQSTDQAADANAATAAQNVPQAAPQPAANGTSSSEAKERREELTNYEINETTTQTVSDGYDVRRLSIAVVVNRARLAATLGENPTQEQIDAALAEVKTLVASAAGITDSRGDQLEVTAVDFVSNGQDLQPVPSLGYGEMLLKQSGTMVNALTILVVAVLVIWFGLKPAIRAISAPAANDNVDDAMLTGDGPIELQNPMLDSDLGPLNTPPGFGADLVASLGYGEPPANDDLFDELTRNRANSPKVRLEKLVDFDEAQAAAILKQWIHQKEAA
ncbi:flagellar basal-body MS-ring/collar protein FliF [Aureimonas phyllosphaerae]|uniref:Flagellar M-ring protein n=1 Tax=Aureimonas phyllosphaerae TaxID=1166078 RepID=A0A7W6FU02_9HYPH|nr:flagellar basal-body MS-ring/collar protein FliF [Aureimonas phyllosphaerae]MBB3935566.1 flagellar M-ring protein FliF [Aureimonas phyllosphaerae]MBB3959574.1 flagellar M-ring protein FliF [Aureimonas phyllosphaerae]SFF12357.1 flagellar M-ring protein FliF [Aureimonas phyllosphaerae]